MRIPVLRLGRVLLTAIQSDFTDEAAATLQSDILSIINDSKAEGLVIDISAMDVIDSYMVRLLSETARMARILGGEVIISGMQPMVALTLMEMGPDLTGVRTAVNLEAGLDLVKTLLRVRDTAEVGNAD